MNDARIRTYARKLDERMGGGIPSGTVSLICGSSGCMKTSFAYSILYHNALKADLSGMYITMEQPAERLRYQMESMGMGEETTDLMIVDRGRIDEQLRGDKSLERNWVRRVRDYIVEKNQSRGYGLVAVDSLSALYALTTIENPRKELYLFFEKLRDRRVTTFLISEMTGDDGFGEYGVEDFLVDNVIHLDFVNESKVLRRYLGIVKMRYSSHDLRYHPLLYVNGEFALDADE